MSKLKCTYQSFGDLAILVDFPPVEDQTSLANLLKLQTHLRNLFKHELEDLVFTFNSMCLHFKKPPKLAFIKEKIEHVLRNGLHKAELLFRKHWEIPVCFDLSLCADLIEHFDGDIEQVTDYQQIICLQDYLLGFYGFMPGFCYLSGLPKDLAIKRKASPSRTTARGSLAVGGRQLGIYPQDSPGGWCVIGRTPIRFFDATKDQPLFAQIGDIISFKPVTLEHFNKLQELVDLGMLPMKNSIYHGDN